MSVIPQMRSLPTATPLRAILLIETQRLVREGLAALLQREYAPERIVATGRVHEAIDGFDAEQFDLILYDHDIAVAPGSAVRSICTAWPRARLLVLMGRISVPAVSEAVHCGAIGCLPKTSGVEVLTEAIRYASAGQIYLPEGFAEAVNRCDSGHTEIAGIQCTRQEAWYIEQILSDRNAPDMVAQRGRSVPVIKREISTLLRKFGVGSRTQLIIHLVTSGAIGAIAATPDNHA